MHEESHVTPQVILGGSPQLIEMVSAGGTRQLTLRQAFARAGVGNGGEGD